MTYFTNCRTAEEAKQEYKKLARKLHPDCNAEKDTTAEFQKMQADFEAVWNCLKDIHTNADGETYTKETSETAAQYMDIINRLLVIPGIVIELCGSWLWITGNTYAARNILKELKFKWSSKKSAWYFHNEPYRKRSKKERTMEDIRNMYGSEKFQTHTMSPDLITA